MYSRAIFFSPSVSILKINGSVDRVQLKFCPFQFRKNFFTSHFLASALIFLCYFATSAQPRRDTQHHSRWTHLLNPYSTHYPHCFADCLLSPVLAQPAMEGVEVRWRPAVESSLAPLSLCSWLLCASGVFVTVSLCLWCCVWPLRFTFLRWSLSNLLPYDILRIYDVFRNQPATLTFLQMFPDLSLLIVYYRRYTCFSNAG